jgi:isocitrate dehydrogenase
MNNKIDMKAPLVELDGDEMARVIWRWVKEILIEPNVNLKTEYYDLGLANREKTNDEVTNAAAEAIKKFGVGVKCAGITPNADRVKEYGLSQMYKSPNGTIRAILGGTVFREPIIAHGITPLVPTWKEPIVIARHAYGDIYKNVELKAASGSRAELVCGETREVIHDFTGAGVVQGMHNTDESIFSFARACFEYAAFAKKDLWFATKDTISKVYDRRFRDIFQTVYEDEYAEKFAGLGIEYFYTLIDDMVARVMRSSGGFVWACKNYDGDVMSDMLATAFGSLAMMTSVLVSPQGYFEYEAAHGTVQKHYYKHKEGEVTSTNSVATIFAWTGALRKRGELDGIVELSEFAARLETATKETIESGIMTGDLYTLSDNASKRKAGTREFIEAVSERIG